MIRFKNSKWLHYSNRDNFERIIIHLDVIPTELSNKDSDHLTQSSSNELQYMDIQQIEDQLEKVKQVYTNETGKTVIDKQYSQ